MSFKKVAQEKKVGAAFELGTRMTSLDVEPEGYERVANTSGENPTRHVKDAAILKFRIHP